MNSCSLLSALLIIAAVSAFVPSRFATKSATKLNERFTKFQIESDPLIFSEVPLRENFMQDDYRLTISDFFNILFKKEEEAPAPPAPVKKAPVKKSPVSVAKSVAKAAVKPVAVAAKAAPKPVAKAVAAPKPAPVVNLAPQNPKNGQRKTVKVGKK